MSKKTDKETETTVSINGGPEVPIGTLQKLADGIKEAAGYAPRTKDVTETLKHNLSDVEKLALGQKLAEANIEADGAEAEKKSVTSTLKAKCEGCIAKVSELSSRLSAGYEYRQVVCRVTFDNPNRGQKTTRRIDTNEVVKTEDMTLAEMQARLPGIED